MSKVALVVGHATLDLAGDTFVPGGSAYYAGRALAALGATVRVLTAAGPDLPGDAFRAGGLPPGGGSLTAAILPSARTTVFENLQDSAGRRRQRARAAAPPLEPSHLPRGWGEADLLLLAPVLGEVDPAAFVRAVRAPAVGLLVQGLVRDLTPGGEIAPRRLEWNEGALAGIGAAFLGEDEAEGQPDLAASLARAVPVVALTHGARGSEVRAFGRAYRVGIHPAREADPTGAGDVYAAAFMLALASGAHPREAARLGAAAGSIAVEGRGGDALPRVGEAWARAASVEVEELPPPAADFA